MTFLGMQVGEFWDLDPLAEHCAADGRYEFLLASAPMSLPGGCGSSRNQIGAKVPSHVAGAPSCIDTTLE
jgi:hypothetical protein